MARLKKTLDEVIECDCRDKGLNREAARDQTVQRATTK